ncbi:MAG: glycogen debranching enzyme N-terminal domain-containing protein [Acidobacteriota bacterium]
MEQPIQIGWRRGDPLDSLLSSEWLVTNALGGYASGTIGGACTRRFHGQLIAALPAPAGRLMMLNHIEETIALPDGHCLRLSGDEQGGERAIAFPEPDLLEEFGGLPVWRFSRAGLRVEKRLFMPHEQNTTYIIYKLLGGPPGLALNVRPSLHFRPHEGLLNTEVPPDWSVVGDGRDLEIRGGEKFPALRLALLGRDVTCVPRTIARRSVRFYRSSSASSGL